MADDGNSQDAPPLQPAPVAGRWDARRVKWRGKVQALPGGEAYCFRGWPGLIERLEALLASGIIAPPFNSHEVTMSVESTHVTLVRTGAVHHVALTVSDVRRSQLFYTRLLGFNFVTDFGRRRCCTMAASCWR